MSGRDKLRDAIENPALCEPLLHQLRAYTSKYAHRWNLPSGEWTALCLAAIAEFITPLKCPDCLNGTIHAGQNTIQCPNCNGTHRIKRTDAQLAEFIDWPKGKFLRHKEKYTKLYMTLSGWER